MDMPFSRCPRIRSTKTRVPSMRGRPLLIVGSCTIPGAIFRMPCKAIYPEALCLLPAILADDPSTYQTSVSGGRKSLLQVFQRDVAAGANNADFSVAQRLALPVGGGEGGGSGPFGQGVGALDHPDHRLLDFRFADEQEIVERLPEDTLWQFKGCGGCEPLSGGAVGHFHQLMLPPGLVSGGRGFSLHADDAQGRFDGAGNDAGSGSAAAAANRDEQHIQFRLVLQNFERSGGNPGDEQRLVAGMDIAVAMRCRQSFAVQARIVKAGAVKDDL